MRFIHIADVHLGMKPDQGCSWALERTRDIEQAFDRLLDEVTLRQADLLLIAGDLFHRPPTGRELKELNYKLSKLEPAKVVMIAGNHDYVKAGQPNGEFEFASNITFLKEQSMESVSFPEIDTTVYGLSYHNFEIREPLYDSLKPSNDSGFQILLAHGGDDKHCPMNYERLKWSGFDYIALGHIHKPQVLAEDLMAYAGSLTGLDVTETGPRGYIYGEMTEEHQKITFHPISGKQYVDLVIPVQNNMTNGQVNDFIAAKIKETGPLNIYHLILAGTKAYDFELDLYPTRQQYHISKITDQLEEDYDLWALAGENKDNLLGRYIEKLNQADASDMERKALHYGVKALLRAQE